MTQVDLGLTAVGRFDSANSIISINNTNKKTWGVTLMLHTFYFSLTPNSSRFLSMCAGSDIMDKIISEAAQFLQRISNGQRTQRDWQRRCREEQNDKSKPEVLAEISKKD
jgi:hypothetical protein